MPGKTVVLRNNDVWAGAASSEAEAESAEGRREGFGASLAFRAPPSPSSAFYDLLSTYGKPFSVFAGGISF